MKIEELFVSSLGSKQRLKWYLQHNVNLVKYLEQTQPQLLAFIDFTFAFIPKKEKIKMIEDMSVGRMLKVLETDRLDLFKTINTGKGIAWISRQIKNFEGRFL